VRLRSGWLFGDADDANRAQTFRDENRADLRIERIRNRALVPDMQFVAARWNVRNDDGAMGVGDSVVGSFQGHHHSAHFWVNVAEDIADAFAVEHYTAAGSCFIETEVKAFPIEQREDVVEERVFVGKDHSASHGYNDQVRSETFVSLHELLSRAAQRRRRLAWLSEPGQPNDAVGGVADSR
jgi:hypothetical protein